MKPSLGALGAGLVFGVGLAISGMTHPSKILAFLDVAGHWDPSLMFVMMGALAVHLVLARFILKRSRPLFDIEFHLPAAEDVDTKLVVGAAVFGVGWGLGGFCPGPALVSAGTGTPSAIVFVAAMAVGMTANHFLPSKRV